MEELSHDKITAFLEGQKDREAGEDYYEVDFVKIRKNLGQTQEQFAKTIGISRTYLAKIETKVKLPSVQVMQHVELIEACHIIRKLLCLIDPPMDTMVSGQQGSRHSVGRFFSEKEMKLKLDDLQKWILLVAILYIFTTLLIPFLKEILR